MSAFAGRVAAVTGAMEGQIERLAAESLSEVLLVRRPDGPPIVAKTGPALGVEAAMLRALAGAGIPVPMVEGEHEGVLLLSYVANDGLFSANAWSDIGTGIRHLHDRIGESYGWPADYALGTVALDNRESRDWPRFWGEQRLVATAGLLDRPWRERVERLAARIEDLVPAEPAPALLHGDLWSGNILVEGGRLAALVDPACYHGDAEVDLAMLDLFGAPPDSFDEAYGPLAPGWRERRPVYQLFPALVHIRLWGPTYHGMADRLLSAIGF